MESILALINGGDYDLAIASINHLLEADQYNIKLLTLKADAQHKNRQHYEAITTYSELINLMPNEVDFYAGRGIAYYGSGEHKHSLADFTKAIELEPNNGYRYASRAYILDAIGEHLQALADYNKAIELDPEDAVSLNNRGLVEEKLGRMHLSQQSFAAADKLAGINLSSAEAIIDQAKEEEQPASTRQPRAAMSWDFIFSTIKHLFTSPAERNNFYKFLTKRK